VFVESIGVGEVVDTLDDVLGAAAGCEEVVDTLDDVLGAVAGCEEVVDTLDDVLGAAAGCEDVIDTHDFELEVANLADCSMPPRSSMVFTSSMSMSFHFAINSVLTALSLPEQGM
jgi:hypothetical protein